MEYNHNWDSLVRNAKDHLHGIEWSLNGTMAMLWRRWQVIGAMIVLCVTVSGVVLLLTPAEYTSEALMQINTRKEQVTGIMDVLSDFSSSDASVQTEVDILRSRKLAQRVVEKLNLINNPDMRGSGLRNALRTMKSAVVYFMFPNREAAVTTRQARLTRAVDNFLARLDVAMLPRSYSILVHYTSYDPTLAATVVNEVGNQYLTSQLEDKFDATKRANDWMTGRVKEMQASLRDAELAVQKFREEHGLTQAKGITLTEQQLSELNSQLILARTQLAESQAKLAQSQEMASNGRGIETTSEVLNSPLIQNLSQQETEVRRKMSDLAARYGDRHPRMQTVRNELADVQRKIHEETRKIQGSLGNDVEVSKARVNTLEDQLNELQEKTRLSGNAEVQLSELERRAQAERNLYEAFLKRSSEIAQMDFAQNDARVISKGEIPLTPSKPNKLMVLLLAGILGTILGVGLAMLLEALDSGFRTTQQLEAQSGVASLGLIGELPTDEKHPSTHVLRKPTGAFAEAIRAAKTALMTRPGASPKTILVTSSVPQEGKSLFALSLALTASKGGQKVLIIDTDLRRPTLAKRLELKAKVGLEKLLAGDASFKDVSVVMKDSGMVVIPAMGGTDSALELLSSPAMKKLLSDARNKFDLVVLDTPPVMAVSDAVSLSTMVDTAIFVVRWGMTPRPVALNAIKQLLASNASLSGVVLTRVDLEKQRTYGQGDYGYYYGKYKEYYTND